MVAEIVYGCAGHSAGLLPSLIVLTGFRATGKTAVGRCLAALLRYQFIDTDQEITARLGCSIAESVNNHGWQPFRDLERELLKEVAGQQKTVVATGGGAILHHQEWQQLHRHAFVVWLRANTATILARLQQDKKTAGQRPSLSGQDPATEIAILLAEREPLYRAGSDRVLDTENRTPEELAALLFTGLQKPET